MKYLLPIIISLLIMSCTSKEEMRVESTLSNPETEDFQETKMEEKSETIDSQVALDFMNSYIENCNKMRNALGIVEWTKGTPLATEKFKNELIKMVNDALKEDPEMGLGFDPIFDAQDYPDEGVKLKSFDPKTGYLAVQGVNWDTFEASMKVVNQKGVTLVDGCGVVNIPSDKQAKR